MKALTVLLLIASACLALRHPHPPDTAPDEPHLFPKDLDLNVTSLKESVPKIDPSILGVDLAEPPPQVEKLIGDGCRLVDMMSMRDGEAARFIPPMNSLTTAMSPWRNWDDIKNWGWVDAYDDIYAEEQENALNEDFEHVFPALGLPKFKTDDSGTAYAVMWQHHRRTTHENQVYKPTDAKMKFFVDPTYGLILATYTFGPSYTAPKQKPPVTTIPKFKNLYDFFFLDYKRQADKRQVSVKKLKYIIVNNIENPITEKSMEWVLGMKIEDNCERWTWDKKQVYTSDSREFHALIASPSGRSPALLLIRHKNDFGEGRKIDTITFWCSAAWSNDWNLLFTVGEDHGEGGNNPAAHIPDAPSPDSNLEMPDVPDRGSAKL